MPDFMRMNENDLTWKTIMEQSNIARIQSMSIGLQEQSNTVNGVLVVLMFYDRKKAEFYAINNE